MANMDAYYCLLMLVNTLITKVAVQAVEDTPEFKCYVCSVTAKQYRLNTLDPCIFNTTALFPVECAPTQKYCQVKTTVRYNQIISLERKCASSCQNGCLRYTFAIWKVMCTDCCNQSECNVYGGVSRYDSNYWLIIMMLLFHIVVCFAFDAIVGRFYSK